MIERAGGGRLRRYKEAKVICDPEIMDSLDPSIIDSEFVLGSVPKRYYQLI